MKLVTISDPKNFSASAGNGTPSPALRVIVIRLMAYLHCRTGIRTSIPNPMGTLYYAEVFALVRIQIQIPTVMVSLNGYCTHFRDGCPFQGRMSIPILLYFNQQIQVQIRTNGKFLHSKVIRVQVRV